MVSLKKTLFFTDQSGSKILQTLTCLLNVQKPIFLKFFSILCKFVAFFTFVTIITFVLDLNFLSEQN